MRKFSAIFGYLITSLLTSIFPFSAKAQMEFVQNKGQWHSNVTYRGDFNTGSFFLESQGFTVLLHQPSDVQRLSAITHGHSMHDGEKNISVNDPFIFHSFAYKVKFLGAAENPQQLPDKIQSSHNNYFIGNDPSKWAGECKIFQAVTYKDIYPNIDIRYYSDAGKLKYDFIVKPGGKISSIAMQYDGISNIAVKDKELLITTPFGRVKELYPYTYQAGEGKRSTVNCRYVINKNVVSFKVDNYNENETLVIDPSVIFSTFTGSTSDNWGYTATPGADGSFFAGGIAFAAGYPVSPGAFQRVFNGGSNDDVFGGYDMAIFKFSASGSNRIYATYLGGAGNEQPHSMIADAQGNLIIAGRSNSLDYPVKAMNGSIGNGGGYDIVVSKLDAAGAVLMGSVKMGGSKNDGVNIRPKYPTTTPAAESLRRNYGDDARSEVIMDAANNIFLVSCTQSTGSEFPTRNPVQSSFAGGSQDGVIIKFNAALNTILFSTYFGGNGDDACFVTNISPTTGDLYVAGATSSTNLPGNTSGVMSPLYKGNIDGFVTQLRSDGSAIIRTTYQGTDGIDLVYGLKFDRFGFPYIMGTTTLSWPIQNAAFNNPNGKQFISKLQPDLSAYVYSTAFGNSSPVPNISPSAFLVDRCENVYVSGWGGGINVDQGYTSGNTNNLPMVNPLAGIPAADGKDFYFFVLEKCYPAVVWFTLWAEWWAGRSCRWRDEPF